MSQKILAHITALGHYLPEYVLTNKELETMVDTNDEWIVSRTGIKERRILKEEGKATSHMAVEAIKEILNNTELDPLDIDAIIVATVTPDYVFPATACLVQDMIGANNSFGFDLSAACSGFLFALTTGAQMIETGRMKNVIVVGADKMSAIINYEDRDTCILFGDGAGAVLLQPTTDGNGIIDFLHRTDGSGAEALCMPGGGSRYPATHESVDKNLHYAYQDGRTVFKRATAGMADISVEIMKKNNLSSDDVDWLVPHQANLRIIDATARRMGLNRDKVMVNIDKYGNTTAATIPLCLYDYKDKLNLGDTLILSAFGGGYTWGSVYLKWGI